VHLITDDDIDFRLYESETEAKQRVLSASIYVQQLIDSINSPKRERVGLMPWGKTHKLIQFRDGETTVWGGPNGSGKSLVTGQVALSLCAQDEPVAVASFEMKPDKTMDRMGRQWTKFSIHDELILADRREKAKMLDAYAQFRDWTDGKLWLYDRQGTVQWKQVVAVARYCAKELGIKHFFVDNLGKCVSGEDDFNGQKAFVDELCAVGRDHGMHIHIVHHIRKPAHELDKPTKYDFKGSGAITDQPDNVIAVWRNKQKERERKAGKLVSDSDPDAMLIVDKQRNGEGWEGNIGLWFNRQSTQFIGAAGDRLMDFYNPPKSQEPDEC
jgi:twinkle protein